MSKDFDNSLLYKILMMLFALLIGVAATYAIFFLIVLIQCGFGLNAAIQSMPAAIQDASMLRVFQSLQSFCVFIIPAFLLTKTFGENPQEFLSLRRPDITSSLIAAASLILAVPVINFLAYWNGCIHLPYFMKDIEIWMKSSEDSAAKITKILLAGTSWKDLTANIIIIALLAGIGEEFFFRGLLQSMLKGAFMSCAKSGDTPAWIIHSTIWIIAFIFSAIHLQFYGFIPRLLLGAWFGYLLWWSGSIWIPVIAHFTNNALSTITNYAENKGVISSNTDLIGVGNTSWYCIISIIMVSLCALFFIKKHKKA